jgi:MFS family permease
MKPNLRVLLGVSIIFGTATGIYEFILPYFLRAQGVSLPAMGVIFAGAGLAMLAARLYMGGLADRWGRKIIYGWSLAACGLATGLAPLLPGLVAQFLLKTMRETAALTRETIHPVVLYEEARQSFLNLIGKYRGIEFLLQAGGTMLAGGVLLLLSPADLAYRVCLYLAGAAVLVGALWWALVFREHWQPGGQRIIPLRELLDFNLHPNLLLLMASMAIFAFGMQLSHSFYLPLFFRDRFGMAPEVIAIIMVLHRVTIAVPMLLIGQLGLKNLRAWYIGGLIVEGITMAGSAVIPLAGLSAAVFLLHDLVGAGIWVPIQATLIQRYSRDAARGMEVGKVLAWSSIGGILGPLAAGWLAEQSTTYPYFFSGVLMSLACIPLFWFRQDAPSPDEMAAKEAPVTAA